MKKWHYYYYNTCICGRRKTVRSLHCKSCANTKQFRKKSTLRKISRAMKGRKITWNTFHRHTAESKRKLSIAHTGKILSAITRKRISRSIKRLFKKGAIKLNTRQLIIKHHIDLDKSNDKKQNILTLSLSKHGSLHHRAYDYLVKTRQVDKYIKWFIKKYGL
jgi:hypothetical protein